MSFFNVILSYPTIIYTILLCVGLVYWLVAIIGLVDFESAGPDLDVDFDADLDIDLEPDLELHLEAETPGSDIDAGNAPASVSTLAAKLVALGLSGVPFSVVISLLTLFSWVISSIVTIWVLGFFPPDGLSRFVFASAVLVGAFAFAIPATAICVRPMRRLFVKHSAISNASLVGQECVVLTGTVDEKFGRAEVLARGAGYHIHVVADTPNNLKRGDTAFIMDYDEATEIYRIAERNSY
ncbi:MAG: YqiJ family protein [Azoarcus sp.]|jgi:co-chaperonin GroES (HSP10)|nr:YqiJ family protein [Azoarcus sp.]